MTKKRSIGKRNKGSKAYSKAVLKAAIKVKNCRKCLASDSGDSSESDGNSSDDTTTKRLHCKKVRSATEVDEKVESVLEEVEVEVVDSELLGEEPEVEHRETAQKDKVSVN